ncbi:hypothetical protein [Myroides pelagicus]|uniref:Glycine zipper family protein n=1 Tax=Myroides pelagicus TaxID=270914 RepID=A0A7K1GNB6_9FLAO|nr:hypothetical protein [Myroides pelagicus]MTH30365.1 hypothetical protein [Myroides pelagicus]
MFFNSAKKESIQRLRQSEVRLKEIIDVVNEKAINLYVQRKSASIAIQRVEEYINTLANTPKEFLRDIQEVKLNIKEFNQAVRIEDENMSNNIKGASAAGTGLVVGGAVTSLGPTAAMAIATTFGTASTGTAIASLSGAAATNAALAWLGGGALTAGGAGMTGGSALLALAGPLGWGIAGVLIAGGGAFAASKNKKAAEQAKEEIIKVEEQIAELTQVSTKLNYYIEETTSLKSALDLTLLLRLCPDNYLDFDDIQKKRLAGLINNTRAMGELINKRIV